MFDLKKLYQSHKGAVLTVAGLLGAALIVCLMWGAYNLFLGLAGLGVATTLGGARPRGREPAIEAMDEAESLAGEIHRIDEASKAEAKKLNTKEIPDDERKKRLLEGLD